jgi:phosphomevalonate kinase
MDDLKQIEQMLAEINSSAEQLSKAKPRDINPEDLPSNLSLMLGGISNSKALDMIFSSRVDTLIEKLMDLIMSGKLLTDIEKFLKNEDDLRELLTSLGFGEGSFKGPVSQRLVKAAQKAVDSPKFNKLKNDSKKVVFIYKKLKLESLKLLKNPEEYKKYNQALKAIRKILSLINQIYKNRAKIVRGLSTIVNENTQEDIQLEPLFLNIEE